jgi:hypothetical protein
MAEGELKRLKLENQALKATLNVVVEALNCAQFACEVEGCKAEAIFDDGNELVWNNEHCKDMMVCSVCNERFVCDAHVIRCKACGDFAFCPQCTNLCEACEEE